MKKKKLLAMLLCMATAVSFTACSKDKPVTEQTGEETALYDDVWDGTYNGEEVLDVDQTIEEEAYNFTGTNRNGLVIKDSRVSFKKLGIVKNSDSTRIREAAVTKGLGAACFVTNGTLLVDEGNISTDAAGATGVFSFTEANADMTSMTINTAGVYSPGVESAGGGSATLSEGTVTTEGREAAGVRCVDPNSYIYVGDSKIETKGKNSPGVYAGASVDLSNCEITAYSSEVLRFSGLAGTWTENCTLTGNKTGTNANDFNWTVIACADEKPGEDECAELYFVTSTLTSHSGGLFYATNTNCAFYIDNCELVNSESDDDYLLRCQGNNDLWGRKGTNGAKCKFVLGGTDAKGGVYYDSSSELNFYVTNMCDFTGFVKKDEKFVPEAGTGHCTIGIQDGCKWIVTQSSEFENLECCGEIVDEEGKAVTVKGKDGTVYMEGDSDITVTVDTFSEVVDY